MSAHPPEGIDGRDVPFTASFGFQATGYPDWFKQSKPFTEPSQSPDSLDQA